MFKLKKPFNEMSVLFPLLTLYTLVYLALMGYDFAAKDGFEIPPGMMAIYMTLVFAYSADREVRRWTGNEMPARKGTLFVYLWLVFFLVVFTIRCLRPVPLPWISNGRDGTRPLGIDGSGAEYALPNDLTKVALQVMGVFFGSKLSKKIFQFKNGTVDSVFSLFKGNKEEKKSPKGKEEVLKVDKKLVEAPATSNGKNPEEAVLELIRKNGRAKREDLLPVTGMSRSSLGRLLDGMETKGFITQMGIKKGSYYILRTSQES